MQIVTRNNSKYLATPGTKIENGVEVPHTFYMYVGECKPQVKRKPITKEQMKKSPMYQALMARL